MPGGDACESGRSASKATLHRAAYFAAHLSRTEGGVVRIVDDGVEDDVFTEVHMQYGVLCRLTARSRR